MERDQDSAFAEASLENTLKLPMARDLQRQFSAVLAEPLPPDLRRFITLLQSLPSSQFEGKKG